MGQGGLACLDERGLAVKDENQAAVGARQGGWRLGLERVWSGRALAGGIGPHGPHAQCRRTQPHVLYHLFGAVAFNRTSATWHSTGVSVTRQWRLCIYGRCARPIP